MKVSALAQGDLQGSVRECVHTHIHAHTHTNTHKHTTDVTTFIHTRLSPEFYDNIIRLPIPISSDMLMMIGMLPMHPSPDISFCSLVVGGWDRGGTEV